MKRDLRVLAMGVAMAMAVAGLAQAADVASRCQEDSDEPGVWAAAAFGGYRMGQADPCPEVKANGCSLTDFQGGSYGVDDGKVSALTLYTSPKTRSLPFGLKHDMRLEAVLAAYYSDDAEGRQRGPDLTVYSGENGFTLGTGYCLLGLDGRRFRVLLHFDNRNHFHKIEYGSAR